jgi:hypothetical protein
MADDKTVDTDGYYDEDVDTDEEIDLSFLDEKDKADK